MPQEMTDEQLTRAICEEVMGWQVCKEYFPVSLGAFLVSLGAFLVINNYAAGGWVPLTNPAHWWQVVDRMVELGFGLVIRSYSDGYEVNFWKGKYFSSLKWNANIGRAVCEAALLAVRSSEE